MNTILEYATAFVVWNIGIFLLVQVIKEIKDVIEKW